MILEKILDLFFLTVNSLVNLLPFKDIDIDSTAIDKIFDILNIVAYMLPMPTVIVIISLIIGTNMMRIMIALIKTIWNLLPFV